MDQTVNPTFYAFPELDARLDAAPRPPRDRGSVEMLVIRPDRGRRETSDAVELRADRGVVGDSWLARAGKGPDGTPNFDTQVTLMSTLALNCLTDDRGRWQLAGDQLIVDLDLGEANLPAGSRLRAGDAVLEISARPHTGCAKFKERFGPDAVEWVNSTVGRSLRLRGVLARVLVDGEVRVGDAVEVVSRPE